ncbi:MAG: phage baseplate assembly protein V, partial [Acidimicrobiales bacterium]
MEGQCVGNPYIHAGESMSLGMVGLPFDGQYIVTSARHVFEPAHSGYTTWFTVGGRRDRSTFALASGAGPADHNRPTVAGVVIGKVSDNNDPEKLGRVKVIFPWLWETYVSAWARTVQIGAGTGGYGFLWVPEVGDEVLVGFDRGDVGYPYVIGNLYNGINRPEPPPSIDGAVASRRIMSRERHQIQFFDGPSASGITILSGDETLSIKIDAEEQAITIQSEGMVTVQAADALTIKSDADISIQAGGQVSVQGEGGVTVTGSDIALSAEGEASLTGASVSVEGDTDVSISGPAISLGA